MLIVLALVRRSTRLLLILGPLLGAIWFAAIVIAGTNRVIVEPLYPSLVLGLAWVSALGSQLTAERAERQTVQRLFGRYVSTAVATEVARRVDSGELSLGGERHEITAMFADIRGFTQLSGEVEPEVAMLVVNQIMQVLIRQVDAGGGIVNKFSGDGLLAVWNVPQAHANHVGAAVAAAEAALREWASWSGGYPGVSDVQFAVGIDTGTAVAGIVGTEQRSEYTVIGDTVNLAARLCAAAPGGSLWVSDAVAKVQRFAVLQDEGPQTFKGRAAPMRVWSLDPARSDTTAERPVRGVEPPAQRRSEAPLGSEAGPSPR